MKRLFLLLSVLTSLLAGSLLSPPSLTAISAAPICDGAAANTDVCKSVKAGQGSTDNPIIGLLKTTVNILSYIIGIAAVIIIIVSAIRLITSVGDAQAAAGARSAIIYSLIGIAVVALAQVIVAFVITRIR